MIGLGGASWVVRVRIRVSYLDRNFVVVLINSVYGAIFESQMNFYALLFISAIRTADINNCA